MALNTAPAPAAVPTGVTPPADGVRSLRRLLLGLGIIVLLFAIAYALAWNRANTLATTYLADADRSYDGGNYLQALTGYEEFDAATNTYLTRGGYMKVARIWADPRAEPRPPGVQRAQQRIDEILNQRLTIEDAEDFIQANTGKPNPYMGAIYLRLGELYEKEGDQDSAKQIYEELPDLFPNEPDLIKRAQENLQRLGG